MNNYLIVGAGLQAEAIAYDLLKFDQDSKITIVDKYFSKSMNIRKLNTRRVIAEPGDASELDEMIQLMKGKDVAIGASSYKHNVVLTKAAIITGTNFLDLGGSNSIAEQQFTLDKEAKDVNICVVPNTGVGPGADCTAFVLAYGLIEKPKYARMLVGGNPQNPWGEFKYMGVFSYEGLIQEYVMPVEIIQNGKRIIVEPLTGIEDILYKDQRLTGGEVMLEATRTSGGLSTLAKTFEGKIETLEYKTLRYPGHWKLIKKMYDNGDFREDQFIKGKSRRQISQELFEKEMGYKDRDVIFLQVIVGNDEKEVRLQMTDFYDDATGHTAMQRTTGYSASIIAQMIAKGEIKDKGVLYVEKSIPPSRFFEEWSKRGINLERDIIIKK